MLLENELNLADKDQALMDKLKIRVDLYRLNSPKDGNSELLELSSDLSELNDEPVAGIVIDFPNFSSAEQSLIEYSYLLPAKIALGSIKQDFLCFSFKSAENNEPSSLTFVCPGDTEEFKKTKLFLKKLTEQKLLTPELYESLTKELHIVYAVFCSTIGILKASKRFIECSPDIDMNALKSDLTSKGDNFLKSHFKQIKLTTLNYVKSLIVNDSRLSISEPSNGNLILKLQGENATVNHLINFLETNDLPLGTITGKKSSFTNVYQTEFSPNEMQKISIKVNEAKNNSESGCVIN